jgi:sugar O-acyltransferase (sialic acid O-acetyltransferase NeuD family)
MTNAAGGEGSVFQLDFPQTSQAGVIVIKLLTLSTITLFRDDRLEDPVAQIIIFGAGKIAEVVHAYITGDPQLSIAGFCCDRAYLTGDEFHGLPLVAFEDVQDAFSPAEFLMLVAIGYQDLNRVRAERCRQAREKGYRLISWVSPRAYVSPTCSIGGNCVIFEGATLQPYARLGDNVFVWSGAVVGHHANIGDHCWLPSNCTISSTVSIEPFCFLGVNSAVGHGVTVGARSIVGAGAVITRSTAPDGVYIARDTERFRLDSQHFARISRIAEG